MPWSFTEQYLSSHSFFTLICSFSDALLIISNITFGDNFSRTITLQRLRRAELMLKEGFSVVAPMSVIVPSST